MALTKQIIPITSLSDCLDVITRADEFLKDHMEDKTSEWCESDRGVALEEIQGTLESLIADFDTALTLPEPSIDEDADE